MKVSDCLPERGLYLSNPIVLELRRSLPEDLEVDACVIHLGPNQMRESDTRKFLFLSKTHLIFALVKFAPIKETNAREVTITTELRPLSAIKEVQRVAIFGVSGPFDLWPIGPIRYTVVFQPDTGWQPIVLPPEEDGVEDSAMEQYSVIGRKLYERMFA